jgi:hypothetical protein
MAFVLTGVLALAGCGKQQPPAPTREGITVNVPKLREAFATATPEVQATLSEVTMGLRYANYTAALDALGKLGNTPSITEAQKTAVNEVTEQIKQLANKDTRAPAR